MNTIQSLVIGIKSKFMPAAGVKCGKYNMKTSEIRETIWITI